MRLADVRALPATLSIPEAARLLHVSRGLAYSEARTTGTLAGVPVVKVGPRRLVPTAPLLRVLGLAPENGSPLDGSAAPSRERPPRDPSPLVFDLPAARCTDALIAEIRGVLRSHPGRRPVRLRLVSGDETRTLALPDELRVANSKRLRETLRPLLREASG